MYVAHEDAEILCSDEVMDMRRAYRKKFGEAFISFNYVDFFGAQQYKEVLIEALKKDEPTRIESHRFDFFDH